MKLLLILALATSTALAGPWVSKIPARKPVPALPQLGVAPINPPARGLTLGQFLHIRHSESVILAQDAARRGDQMGQAMHNAQANEYVRLLDANKDKLDTPHTGQIN